MSEKAIDTKAAEAYESALVPGIFGPWADSVVGRAGIQPGMTVLDVACGSGVAMRSACRLLGKKGRIIGVDFDAGMLEVAKRSVSVEQIDAEFHCAAADSLPLASASVDAVLCLQGLQFFPDRLNALVEMRRVLKAGGQLMVTTWSPIENCKGYWAMLNALESRGIDGAPVRRPFSLSDPIELRTHAERAGFSQVSVSTEERFADFASTEAFVDAIAQGAPSSRHALAKVPKEDWHLYLADVDQALQQWSSRVRLRFPMVSNVLMARR